jgi:hypothetical protein
MPEEDWEHALRDQRMQILESRIVRTDAGSEWLSRLRRVGFPGLRSEEDTEEREND